MFLPPKKDQNPSAPVVSEEGEEALSVDVLFVGGGAGGLSGAIRLGQLCRKDFPEVQIAVLEKGSYVGAHALSGAIIDPSPLKTLFPGEKELPLHCLVKKEKLYYLSRGKKWPLPLPPPMRNRGCYTASLGEVLEWMAPRAEEVNVSLLTSFTADKLIVDQGRVVGVSTFPTGLNRDGGPSASYQGPVAVRAKLVVLCDGVRGHLTGTWRRLKNIPSRYEQSHALGVKELWEVPRPPQGVIHTMGWPLPQDCFGGSWLYPLKGGKVSLGLVCALNSPYKNLDPHFKLQQMKTHPLFREILKGGRCLEWGAKLIPEGGYYALPDRLHDDGLLVVGDSAGMVNVASLKGIHYAMTAGLLAAQTAFEALKKNDFSKQTLKHYDERVRFKSCIGRELYPVRNVRQAFDGGMLAGLLSSGLMFLTGGRFPGDRKKTFSDSTRLRYKTDPDALKGRSKSESVFLSGNKTRDDIPPHLKAISDLPGDVQEFYTRLCPAGVYEKTPHGLRIHAPNCIDCKATDVLGPTWNPKEGGSGPRYKQM